jgi:hypothetical protein
MASYRNKQTDNNNNNNNNNSNKEAEKILQYRPYNGNLAHLECKSKVDSRNNRGNWNH